MGRPPRVTWRARPVYTFATAADSDPSASSVSPELAKARSALLWRATDAMATDRPLDVYTEALVCAVREDLEQEEGEGGLESDSSETDHSQSNVSDGLSGAELSAALDHIAFDKIQSIMEILEVEKGIEVMGTMRQVVVVSCGFDSRAFRVPWPRGTAVFELSHADTHQSSNKILKELKVKPPRGCSHRRVGIDVLNDNTKFSDLEEKLTRAGYSPEVPSVWILQDVCGISETRWSELIEEACDLMCASSEIIGHLPEVRMGDSSDVENAASSSPFGRLILNDLATNGVRGKCFTMADMGFSDDGNEKTQTGIFVGTKVRPSLREAEYYAEQVYLVENEHGDEEGFAS